MLIAPIMFLVSSQAPRPGHYGATDAEIYAMFGLLTADLALLLAALAFALHGPRGLALPCLWFALGGIIIAVLLVPTLTTAKTKLARVGVAAEAKIAQRVMDEKMGGIALSK